MTTTPLRGSRPALLPLLVVLALGPTVASPAAAQEMVPQAGDRVRVTVRVPFFAASGHRDKDLRYVGTLVGWDQLSLTWESDRYRSSSQAPLSRISKLELSQGRKSNWLRGGAIGAGIGLVAGLAWAGEGLSDAEYGGLAMLFVGATAGTGFALGALIGAASPSEKWSAVDPQVYAGPERVVEAAGTAP